MPWCNTVKKELGEIRSNVCACVFPAKSVHYLIRYRFYRHRTLAHNVGRHVQTQLPPLIRCKIGFKVLLICHGFLERCNAQTVEVARKLTSGFRQLTVATCQQSTYGRPCRFSKYTIWHPVAGTLNHPSGDVCYAGHQACRIKGFRVTPNDMLTGVSQNYWMGCGNVIQN